MINWLQIRADILRERGEYCEWCRVRKWTELHHCLLHKMRGKPELDCKENLMAVCGECHASGEVNGYEARRWFWLLQRARYGAAHMRAWMDGLPLKIIPRFE